MTNIAICVKYLLIRKETDYCEGNKTSAVIILSRVFQYILNVAFATIVVVILFFL